jgi:TRAP-type mannitol/chloroaromatic compound transport system substrate-binding protein
MGRAAPTNIVLLDACRNNPLAERLKRSIGSRARSLGLSRGHAPVNPMTVDTLIMFATEPGDVADDGDGRNSPFTSALLRHLAQADEVSLILKDVVADVRAATKGKQRPQQLAAMERKLYLSGKPAGVANDGGEAARLRAELERLKAEAARERANDERPKAAAEHTREETAPRKSEDRDRTRLASSAQPRPAKSSTLTLDLRLQTAFPERMPVLPAQAKRAAAIAAELSDGRLHIQVFPASALVPPSSMLEAVKKGTLDFAWWPAAYPASQNSAFNILGGGVPFGLPPDKLVAWINGEGARFHRELYDTLSVRALPCAVVGADSGFWSRQTIGSMVDLRGLKVRAVGLSAQVLRELGAVPQYLATGDLFPAMERGMIDALEFSIPKIDMELGFHQVARTLHIPAWHQPAMLLDLVVFQARWDSLSPQEQAILTATCQKLMLETLAVAARDEREGLEALSGKGVLFREFPPPVLNALRKASDEVLASESGKNALFKATLESYRRYR